MEQFFYFLALAAFPLAGFAFGRFAVVGDIAFQAAQGGMPAKALEIDLGVIMGGPHADGGMAKLMEIPAWRIFFQSVSA
jgi:hypothetical protein